MRTMKTKLAILFLLAFTITDARAQNAMDKLQLLVNTSARRLEIARQVALSKWDTGKPVEDNKRESAVLASAMDEGKSKNLNPEYVADFFRAQIEANKLVQYSLLAQWRRTGQAPSHTSVDLAATIRPELDRVQHDLIAGLAETAPLRNHQTCTADVAKAVGQYISAHQLSKLESIALDRAMAATCP